MRPQTKILLILAAVLILTGAAAFTCGLAAAHWDFSALGDGRFETEEMEIREEFTGISVRAGDSGVAFAASEDGVCRLIFREPDYKTHAASVKDGTLVVETTDARKWYERFTLFSFEKPEITILLPKAEYALLTVRGSTGDVELPASLRFGEIDVAVSTGDVDCRAACSGQLRICADTGDLRVENAAPASLTLSVTTGSVQARGISCSGDVQVTVSTGKSALRQLTCQNLVSAGSTGALTLENVVARGKIEIARSTGDVKMLDCDAETLDIKTDTGDVTASLITEKVFLVKTDTGRVRVPGTTRGGACRITTDTGDVTVTLP